MMGGQDKGPLQTGMLGAGGQSNSWKMWQSGIEPLASICFRGGCVTAQVGLVDMHFFLKIVIFEPI